MRSSVNWAIWRISSDLRFEDLFKSPKLSVHDPLGDLSLDGVHQSHESAPPQRVGVDQPGSARHRFQPKGGLELSSYHLGNLDVYFVRGAGVGDGNRVA